MNSAFTYCDEESPTWLDYLESAPMDVCTVVMTHVNIAINNL